MLVTGGTYSISSSSWDAGVVDFGNADLDYLGTITAAGGTFTSTTKGKGTISFNLTGTWSATLVIEGHNGDNNWSSLTGYTAAGTPVTSISSNQFFYVNCAAYSQVRLRAPVFVSGTVNIATAATTNLVSIFTQTEGNSAAAAADTGNPLKIGGVGRTALPTAVTDGQRTNLYTDKLGRVVVTNAQARDLLVTNVATITNSTAQVSIGGAAGAGISTDVSTITLANVGATGTEARLRSGDGNVRALYFIPANQTITVNYPVPLTSGNVSVNSNWTVQLSVGTITVYVSVLFVQNV